MERKVVKYSFLSGIHSVYLLPLGSGQNIRGNLNRQPVVADQMIKKIGDDLCIRLHSADIAELLYVAPVGVIGKRSRPLCTMDQSRILNGCEPPHQPGVLVGNLPCAVQR